MWVPLVEYSVKSGVSLSTLRRQIKANKIQHKIDGGKYFIFDSDHLRGSGATVANRETRDSSEAVSRLVSDLRQAQEEISELKMLVALYEEKLSAI